MSAAKPVLTPIDRVRAAPVRMKLLALLGLLLLVLGLSGVLRASSGIEVEQPNAIEIARSQIDFAPEVSEARFVRQGFGLRPVWAVSFSIPTAGAEPSDFDRLSIVEVDAATGDILQVTHEVTGAE